MAQTPGWLRAVARVERRVGTPFSRALNSDPAAGAMLTAGRVLRAGLGAGNAVAGHAVHLLSLPSRRDVARLETKVARLDRAIEELAHTLKERDDESRASRGR